MLLSSAVALCILVIGQATGLVSVTYVDLRMHAHVCANLSSMHTMFVVRNHLLTRVGTYITTYHGLIHGKKHLT